jgi:hypothetical protein
MFCCVRDPIDVIFSYATLVNTFAHSAKAEYEFHTDFPEWWDWWVKEQSANHKKYFGTLFQHCID